MLFVLQEGAQSVAESVATRMLACPMCAKVFLGTKRKYRLDRHMLVHWGLKPFKCPHCPYRSTQQNNLNRHMKNVHSEIVTLMPEGIDARDGSSAMLQLHLGSVQQQRQQEIEQEEYCHSSKAEELSVSCVAMNRQKDVSF